MDEEREEGGETARVRWRRQDTSMYIGWNCLSELTTVKFG
jgi:hypothetical protein